MSRKHKIHYMISGHTDPGTPEKPNPDYVSYWWGYSISKPSSKKSWHLLKDAKKYSNWAHARTWKQALKIALKCPEEKVEIVRYFWKKGKPLEQSFWITR